MLMTAALIERSFNQEEIDEKGCAGADPDRTIINVLVRLSTES